MYPKKKIQEAINTFDDTLQGKLDEINIQNKDYNSLRQLFLDHPILENMEALTLWILKQPYEAEALLMRAQVVYRDTEEHFQFNKRRYAKLFAETLSKINPSKDYETIARQKRKRKPAKQRARQRALKRLENLEPDQWFECDSCNYQTKIFDRLKCHRRMVHYTSRSDGKPDNIVRVCKCKSTK